MIKSNGGIIGPDNVTTGGAFGSASGVFKLGEVTNLIKDSKWPTAGPQGYQVANSCRFNSGSSDYLNGSGGAGSTKTKFTFSTWIKRSEITAAAGDDIILAKWSSAADRGHINFSDTPTGVIQLFEKVSNTVTAHLVTNRLFRDVSAWYHIVYIGDTTQGTAANRLKLYVNGVQETSFGTATYPSENYNWELQTLTQDFGVGAIAANNAGASPFGGYLSEVVYLDGVAGDVTDFGEFDSQTGIWVPKVVTGLTFGTNGFYLPFTNSGALGEDFSGNDNDFTVNNLTSLDQSTDTCSTNFCTLNALNNLSTSGSGTLTEGNLKLSYSGGLFNTNATISVSTGKWYWETKGVSNMQQGSVGARIGFLNQDNTGYANQFFDGGCIFGMYWHPTNGIYTSIGGTQTLRSSTLTYTDGDIIGIALDLTNNISYWYKNGSLSFTYDFSALATIGSSYICPALGNGSGSASPVYELNFGSPPFAISSGNTDGNGFGNFEYAVPSGYLSLNTKNLAAVLA